MIHTNNNNNNGIPFCPRNKKSSDEPQSQSFRCQEVQPELHQGIENWKKAL